MKGVILAAGYGTRFLPVTKVVPKELLPLVDRPALDLVVDELVAGGVDEILVISSRRKKALEDWFDRDVELETVFRSEGAAEKLAAVTPREDVQVHFTRQSHMGGTGHALLQARSFVGDVPFVVAFPDDVFPDLGCTKALVELHRSTGGCALASVRIEERDLSRYGVLDCTTDPQGLRVNRVIEKPAPGEQPSSFVSLGRYLYTPEIFPLLEQGLAQHGGGEFYPMQAIDTLAAQGQVYAAVLTERRWDTGDRLGYLQAVIEAALERQDVGTQLRAWLQRLLA